MKKDLKKIELFVCQKSQKSAYFCFKVFATIKQTNLVSMIVNPVFSKSCKGLNPF